MRKKINHKKYFSFDIANPVQFSIGYSFWLFSFDKIILEYEIYKRSKALN